ncbi:BGTF surface domain-containing protein [Natrarchaeobius chitinivorans]|uniref:PGF-CTERM sorting domain-containing protein n=1 Tax=Natrarchaeobius chitinivorans TaxID=1679083 RepID=A0A3N6PDN4_NATCH|nr:BGTF surface domain-containing protein [Natrarchaeobius chitinivorans]RQG97779.1 PGF-CTERM sorting domain-containing protein [Natrarchaeobius chitinivorans]
MSTRNTTSYREKGRAVFLAALMVMSVFAMSAAFAGSAAAHDHPAELTYEYDGSIAWQGQDVIAYGQDLDGITDNEVELRQVNSFGDDDTSFEAELTIQTAAEAEVNETLEDKHPGVDSSDVQDWSVVVIDTSDLDEEYFFLAHESLPAQSDDVSSGDAFEVSVQSLSAEFDDDEVTDEGDGAVTEIEFDSNRGAYDVVVDADGDLTASELDGIFAAHGSIDLNTEDDEITLNGVSDGEFDADFAGIDTDDYEFTFEVDDTSAEATANISVVEHDRSGSFDQSVYTQTAGDIVEFTVDLDDTDETWIQIGDENAGFVDVVHVVDDEEDGEVSFQVNTRTLGAHDADTEDVYNAGDDELTSEVHDGVGSTGADFHDEEVGDTLGSNGDFADYLDELGLISDASDYQSTEYQLTRPLQATDYDVAANGNGDFIVASDGSSELDDELDLATLDLTTPGVDSISTWVAPGDDADEDELDDLLDAATERTDIAEDDRLIIKAEATGLYGAMVYHDSEDWDALDDGFSASTLEALNDDNYEGINFGVEADDATGNQDPTALNLGADSDEVLVIADNDAGEFYVVVDTSSSNAFDRSLADGMDFTAELEYETHPDERYKYDNGGAPFDGTYHNAYPYFQADSDQSVSTEFTIVEPAVTFDNLDEDDNVQLETSDEFTVTGETNVAPGSDSTVRIRNAGDTPSFLHTLEDTEIASDGTFETGAVDLSDRSEGDEGELTFRISGSGIGSADAVFVDKIADDDDKADDADDEPEPSDDEPEPSDDEPEPSDDEPEPSDDTPEPSDDEPEPEDDDVPGFGIAVALVALMAAAMLALRRQN